MQLHIQHSTFVRSSVFTHATGPGGMSQQENDLWSDVNNPNNDADLDTWADAHNPNNDSYLGDDD